MKGWRQLSILTLGFLGMMAAGTWSAPPEICRLQGGNTKLIFGTGFTPDAVEVYTWSPQFDEDALMAALVDAGYAGPDGLPAAPPEDARQLRVLEVDPRGFTMAAAFGDRYDASGFTDALAGDEVCWVRNADGVSAPYLVRSAHPWWVYPPRARPGTPIRVFGRNLLAGRGRSTLVALRSSRGEVVPLEEWGKVRHAVYECAVRLPEDLAAGEYQLYVHNGAGGTAGWSKPLTLVVSSSETGAPRVVDARKVGAKGNGLDDDTEALKKALRMAARAGDGVVLLSPGRYPITSTLEVPEGVSLRGTGAANSIIEVLPTRPMQAGFPEGAELEGYARDWLPHMREAAAPPMVWLRSRSTLSDLSLHSGPGVGLGVLVARCPGVAESVTIERCVIRTVHEAPGWVPEAPIRIAGDTEGLIVRGCQLAGHGGIDVNSAANHSAYVGDNEMRCIPHGQYNMLMVRGLVNSVVENNIVRDGRRNFVSQLGRTLGKHELPEGRESPSASSYHNILLGNMLYNTIPRRHNEGETMYEAGGAYWQGRPTSVGATTVTVAGEPFWTDMTGTYVLVLDGRGIGQYRRVVASDASSLTVSPPWDVLPDTSTYLTVNGFFAETLWIDNTEEHTANWSGFWGNNVGHVVDGHVLRDGSGFYLWGYRNTYPTPVAFIDIIGSRLIGRGNLRLIGHLVFANTVRFSEIVDFRRRPSFHIQPYWLQDFDPAQVAGIEIGAPRRAGEGDGRLDMEGVPETAPFKDWNVVEGTNIYDGPVGVDIAAWARHTILRHNAIHVDGADVVDGSGVAVIE